MLPSRDIPTTPGIIATAASSSGVRAPNRVTEEITRIRPETKPAKGNAVAATSPANVKASATLVRRSSALRSWAGAARLVPLKGEPTQTARRTLL